MNIYVGNISYNATEDEIKSLFEQHGEVASVNIITDKNSGRSKGFGFVEMPKRENAEEAIKALNGAALKGRNITVNEARPRGEGQQHRRRY